LSKPEGFMDNKKRVHRVYTDCGLQIQKRFKKKKRSHLRLVLPATQKPDQIWSMDFVQDERERNYHLPLPRETGTPAHYQSQMRLRSLAAAMAFQGHYEVMVKPESYLVKDRPKHPLDFLLMG
jgi:hypothetical protein